MVRLRNALLIVAIAAGAVGCHGDGSHRLDFAHLSIFHCSQCDDFPAPNPALYGMMPGTYSGMPPQSESSTRMETPTSSNVPPANNESVAPPPDSRPIAPATPPPGVGTTPPAAPDATNP